jgi:hypothetical protein
MENEHNAESVVMHERACRYSGLTRKHAVNADDCCCQPLRTTELVADDVPISIWAKRGGAFAHSRFPYSPVQLLASLNSWAIDERARFKHEDVRSPDKGTYGYRASLLEAVVDLLQAEHFDG